MSSLIVFDTFGEALNERVDVGAWRNTRKVFRACIPRLNQKIMLDKLIEIEKNCGKECKERCRHGLKGEPGDPLEGALEQADLDPNQLFSTNVRVHADGLMLIGCVNDRCHYKKGIDYAEGQLRFVENPYKSTGGEMLVRVLKSCSSMLEQFLT